jgi:hypothetical protein
MQRRCILAVGLLLLGLNMSCFVAVGDEGLKHERYLDGKSESEFAKEWLVKLQSFKKPDPNPIFEIEESVPMLIAERVGRCEEQLYEWVVELQKLTGELGITQGDVLLQEEQECYAWGEDCILSTNDTSEEWQAQIAILDEHISQWLQEVKEMSPDNANLRTIRILTLEIKQFMTLVHHFTMFQSLFP